MIKAIIFDYDGVISESVNVKTEAFAEMYSQYGKAIENKVVEHHLANGGMSRFEKFKIYHEKYLGQIINKSVIDELSKTFSNIVLQKVISAPYVKGAYEFLSKNYQKFDFHISTGTPTAEIDTILIEKNIRHFFKKVYGSPEKKTSHVSKILREYNYQKNEVVFIGDAIADRDAARKNGIEFIGRFTTCAEIKEEKKLISEYTELPFFLNINK